MAKNREAVTCNGRAAFYAAMWDDIRQCAMDCGWAVALHGSLASDMDIMAMPWVDGADPMGKPVAGGPISTIAPDEPVRSMYKAGYKTYIDGKLYRPKKEVDKCK